MSILATVNLPSRVLDPEGSIIIVNYKVAGLAEQAVESILADPGRPRLEILLVDNSEDPAEAAALSALAEARPEVSLVVCAANRGFAGGNNLGLGLARGEHVALVNPDVQVAPFWFARLRQLLESSPDIGLVGPMTNRVGHYAALRSIDGPTPEQVLAAGCGIAEALRGLHLDMPLLGFFCVVGRRRLFADAGPLEEYAVGGFEDDDYCRRVRGRGLRLALCLDAFVLHHHARSFSQLPFSRREDIHALNRARFEERWGEYADPFDLAHLAQYLEGLAALRARDLDRPAREALAALRESALLGARSELPRVLEGSRPMPGECGQYLRRIDSLESSVIKWRGYIDSLEVELGSRRTTMEEWSKYIPSLEEELGSRRQTMSEWEKRISFLEEEVSARRGTMQEWEKYIASLEEEVSAQRGTMQEWEKYIASLEEEVSARRGTMQEWEKYIASLEAKISFLAVRRGQPK